MTLAALSSRLGQPIQRVISQRPARACKVAAPAPSARQKTQALHAGLPAGRQLYQQGAKQHAGPQRRPTAARTSGQCRQPETQVRYSRAEWRYTARECRSGHTPQPAAKWREVEQALGTLQL
jgi:hypothetical protein